MACNANVQNPIPVDNFQAVNLSLNTLTNN